MPHLRKQITQAQRQYALFDNCEAHH